MTIDPVAAQLKKGRVWARSLLCVSIGAVAVALLAGAAPVLASAAAPERTGPAPIERKVVDELSAQSQTTFWVVLGEKADLASAEAVTNRDARGRLVFDRLTDVADRSQARVRKLLAASGVRFRPFWIDNTIEVTAGEDVLEAVAALPEVAEIEADRVYRIPDPVRTDAGERILATEWGLNAIRAPEVWSTFAVRGEEIVVGSIDTGVRYTHGAVAMQYRGRNTDGTFDHNYNWHDPANVCGAPSLAPCDNHNHGTHTMGTMVGDDAGANQVGVAPQAKWMTAKGCETNFCTRPSLLSAAQFILAPTDLNNQNPRPELRPHIVNNSWGGNVGFDTWYQASVRAWVAAGIFPSFSNGNAGPACGTVGDPASYPESFGVGAFAENGTIASFSSRGPSPVGGAGIKPQVTAPGVAVRSSTADSDSSYALFSGTSMAAPHLSGTVALMWSAAPTLLRDIAATRALLAQSAVDTADLTCGGTDANNNVWGEGKLDAFAAVDLSPRGPTGTLTGTVTDSRRRAGGPSEPIAGATVVASGPTNRTTTTNASGQYLLALPAGSHDVTFSAFGFTHTESGVEITDGGTTTLNAALPNDWGKVAGRVTVIDSQGNSAPQQGVQVQATGKAFTFSTSTDADGKYAFWGPQKSNPYTLVVSKNGWISQSQIKLKKGRTTTADFIRPSGDVSGQVRDAENLPLANATVTIAGEPVPPATTDANGFYSFESVPWGTYDATALAGGCNDPQTRGLVVSGPKTTLDFTLPPCTTQLVSVASDGAQGNGASSTPSVSADGRYVAFFSFASDLVPGDTNLAADVFVYDRDSRATERVSVASDGAQGNGPSQTPSVSPDGRYVAFHSAASSLVPGDTNGRMDVFVHDRDTGATERVSVASDGAQGNLASAGASVSADGRFVAFYSAASSLVPGDSNGTFDVFVHDRDSGATERVSVASDGAQGNGLSQLPFVSADGRYVAFFSLASNLVPGDTNLAADVFVYDRDSGATERVSVAGDGAQGNGQSVATSVSADGRYVAFDSLASNLVPGDSNGSSDVFVHDRDSGATERVSVAGDGAQGNGQSVDPSVSADGRYVAFQSLASNLVPGDSNGSSDVFVHDRDSGATERVSVAGDGAQGNGVSFEPSVSADGHVAFSSLASNLVPGDFNGVQDVFFRHRSGPGAGALAHQGAVVGGPRQP